MKFKESLLTSSLGKDKIIPVIFCLLMFLSGCFEDEDKKPSETDNNKSKKDVMLSYVLECYSKRE